MTPSDELHLICFWQQLGNKWVEISKFMNRSENWVKNNWKKILKREGLLPHEDNIEHIPALIEKLKQNVLNYRRDESLSEEVSNASRTGAVDLQSNVEEIEHTTDRMWKASSFLDREDIKMGEDKLEDDIPDEYGIIHDSPAISVERSVGKVMDTEECRGVVGSNISFQDFNNITKLMLI
jgi:hypothetical protein